MAESKEKKESSTAGSEKKDTPQATSPKKTSQRATKATRTTKGTKKSEEVASRLRIRVRAYEYKVLDVSVQQIIDTALRYDVELCGPIPLPTEIKKYTVNRSSFVYKTSREQFEMRVHKRLIDIINPNQKVIESLTNISLPSGVSIDVKMV